MMSPPNVSGPSDTPGVCARRATRPVVVRWGEHAVQVGGGAPVVVQSMTNTDTADPEATAQQVRELAQAGSELVRVTVNTPDAARHVAALRNALDRMNVPDRKSTRMNSSH